MSYVCIIFYTIILIIFAQASEHVPISVQALRGDQNSRPAGAVFMQQCMQKYGIAHYFSYFDEISKALPGLLPDEVKITNSLVSIPFFRTIHKKTKDEQEQIFNDFTHAKYLLNYPLWRLFLAALSYADIGHKDYILCTAVANEDTALAELMLKQGASADSFKHGYSSLWYCQRVQEAKLLVAYGADVADHQQQNDLIDSICISPDLYADEDGIALLDFYLSSGVQLSERNNFGYQWFKMLLNKLQIGGRRRFAVEAKLELLWHAASRNKKSMCAVTKFVHNKTYYPAVRKLLLAGVTYRLQQRALTGRHFTQIQPIIMKRAAPKK